MQRKVGVVGLGYVGLPVAVAFGEVFSIIGFDINIHRINALRENMDHTGEVSREELQKTDIEFTNNEERLRACDFIIVAVPTPIDKAKQPDLTPLIKASETVGRNLEAGAIVVFESTVYPGATEEICVPILEQCSGLKAGKDFFVGYSPERINPGDKEHTFKKITKIVAGQNNDITTVIADVYGSVIEAGVFRASSIKVAEAAKVIENTQRDLNIALMNELAIIFDRLGIDTTEVLEAAGTKWNFLKFKPGLVGGHCIGVDPYYLTHKAEREGYQPEVILAGRKINDHMGQFIANALIKQLIFNKVQVQGAKVAVLGLTFKENVPDLRNSKVIDVIRKLREFGVHVEVSDALANAEDAQLEYDLPLAPLSSIQNVDAVVLAVPHLEYVRMGWKGIQALLTNQAGIVIDVKGVMDINTCPEGIKLWRL
jgi:UDP-N-acetyl-D-galactosamine dehydrogenase